MRRFADLKSARDLGVKQYTDAVRKGTFPTENEESYSMDHLEWARFLGQEKESKVVR